MIDKLNRSSMSCVAEDYKANRITDEEFEQQMRDLTSRQNMLFNGDVTIHRHRERVLSEIDDLIVAAGKDEREIEVSLSTYFYNIIRGKPPGRDGEQIQFRKDLYKFYDAQPEKHGDVWCPIAKQFGGHKMRRAAHLVPYKIGYETMGDIFDDDGYKLMWSVGNGLIMDIAFEMAFDEYQFCLLPREHPGKPDEWELVLMNEGLRNRIACSGKTWDEYDRTILQFRGDARPQKRFLYFHYWMCLIKAQRELTAGWKDLREKTRMGRLWTTPGPYLRRAMVKKLGASIGDHLLPEQEAIINNTFEGHTVSDDREDVSVKDILSVLIPRPDDEDPDNEEIQDD